MKKYPMLMRPVSKEIIWGGDKLKREYNKTAPFEKLAESWELSVRSNEMCIIDNGEYAGVAFEQHRYMYRNMTASLYLLSSSMQTTSFQFRCIQTTNILSNMKVNLAKPKCGT